MSFPRVAGKLMAVFSFPPNIHPAPVLCFAYFYLLLPSFTFFYLPLLLPCYSPRLLCTSPWFPLFAMMHVLPRANNRFMLNIDLHCHSTASDGLLTPAQLVEYAAARGVEVLALTDHDEVSGLDEARRAAAEHGIAFIN